MRKLTTTKSAFYRRQLIGVEELERRSKAKLVKAQGTRKAMQFVKKLEKVMGDEKRIIKGR